MKMKKFTEMEALLAEADTLGKWQDRAVCKNMDISVFFPNGNEYAQARKVCQSCPVRSECLREAMSHEVDLFGMFGGFTPNEREQYRKVKA